jgi:phosphoglucomutase
VNLAKELRKDGYIVRILGEGSNGGNITHPSSVRDPMGTVFAAVKLLTLRSRGSRPGLYRIWCDRACRTSDAEKSLSLIELLETVPQFTTTGANEQRAILKIRTDDQALLKRRYEEIFLSEWDEQKIYLGKHLGVTGWREINYEGTRAVEGMGSRYRSGKENGGLKILFHDDAGNDRAFIWMRGSKTEPVFRILADVRGRYPDIERHLLEWQTGMIRKADR